MATKLRRQFFKSPYFWMSLVTLIAFVIIMWQVWLGIQKASSQNSDKMLQNIGISNIRIAQNFIESYELKANYIKQMLLSSSSEKERNKVITTITQKDFSIQHITLITTSEHTQQNIIFSPSDKQLYFSYPLEIQHKTYELKIAIPISKLHLAMTKTKQLLHAYITIILDGYYLFHPNENLQGKAVPTHKYLQYNHLTKSYSDYLQMNVYKYTKQVKIGKTPFLFTANIVNLDFEEYLEERGKAFAWILITALSSLLLIGGIGVLRWLREFKQRRKVEEHNLRLALKNEQQKQSAISTELEILKSGLNPHFLFNALSSLKILVERKPELAKEFAVRLSLVYRYMLKQEKKDTVPLANELDFVENYIQLQKIRFGEKIQFSQDIPQELFIKRLPPISIQILVENAIKHTIISSQQPLHIEVYIEKEYIVTANNYAPRLSEVEQIGKGIQNLEKRYALLTNRSCYFSVEEGKYIAKIPLMD